MASAKSEKGGSDAQAKTPGDAATGAMSGAGQGEAAAPQAQSRAQHGVPPKRAVSPLVFGLAVALALVLGLYVGSLAPSLFAPASDSGPRPQAQAEAPAPAAPAATPSAAQESQPPIPPELAAKIAELEKTVLAAPNDAVAWTSLGNLYFDTGQARKAAAAYERSLALAPDNPDVLTDLGIMHRELGEFEKAVADFRRASTVNPRHENAMFNEGVVLYYDLKRKEDAIKAWQRLLAVNPAARAPDGKAVADLIRQ